VAHATKFLVSYGPLGPRCGAPSKLNLKEVALLLFTMVSYDVVANTLFKGEEFACSYTL